MDACKACGISFDTLGMTPSYSYVPQGADHKHRAEHMRRECKRCGYSWAELCAFQRAEQALSEVAGPEPCERCGHSQIFPAALRANGQPEKQEQPRIGWEELSTEKQAKSCPEAYGASPKLCGVYTCRANGYCSAVTAD